MTAVEMASAIGAASEPVAIHSAIMAVVISVGSSVSMPVAMAVGIGVEINTKLSDTCSSIALHIDEHIVMSFGPFAPMAVMLANIASVKGWAVYARVAWPIASADGMPPAKVTSSAIYLTLTV